MTYAWKKEKKNKNKKLVYWNNLKRETEIQNQELQEKRVQHKVNTLYT